MPTPKRFSILLTALAIIAVILFITSHRASTPATTSSTSSSSSTSFDTTHLSSQTLHGSAIAPSLTNETAKAELGRASWRLFHTVFARFPESPTSDEKLALQSWVYLFARMYPCGECAAHFQSILQKFPPQVENRNTAAAWGCHVHNVVNRSLGKDDFDCSNIGDWYDCGCGDRGEGDGDGDEEEEEGDVGGGIGERDAGDDKVAGSQDREKFAGAGGGM